MIVNGRKAGEDDFYAELKQITELRDVLKEIFTCIDTGDPALVFDDEQVAEWRVRAGMPGGEDQ